jgi:hypothetical protein
MNTNKSLELVTALVKAIEKLPAEDRMEISRLMLENDFDLDSIADPAQALVDTEADFQETYITLCRLIRQCNLTADTGVWRCRKDFFGLGLSKEFSLGMGTTPASIIYYQLPLERWDDCYFAKEMDHFYAFLRSEDDMPPDILTMRERIKGLLT